MKRVINSFLEKTFHLSLRRMENFKVHPTLFIRPVGLRFLYFYDLFKKIVPVKGNIVECGVGWGRSLCMFMMILESLGMERNIIGFDSFEGFPDPSSEDEPDKYELKKGRYKTSQEAVREYLIRSELPEAKVNSNLKFRKGFFEDTLKNYQDGPIALLHLDVDLYQSYQECLNKLYPHVTMGGLIVFDEYHETGKYSGARKAIDEFFAGKEKIQKAEFLDRYFVVKE